MALSEIWRDLPRELVEQVLAHHVDDHFDTDPAYTWGRLRHLSPNQKHTIERRFQTFWLPKLSITLYYRTRDQFEYNLDDTTTVGPDGKSTFALAPDNTNDPKPAWDDYNPVTNRNITVRLGEGYLSGGCRGGYLVNDTDLPGLELLDSGKQIRFDWKAAMNELLREELYMRRVGDELFTEACTTWLATAAPSPEDDSPTSSRMPPLKEQVKLYVHCVQIPRRVTTLRHRAAKALAANLWPADTKLHFGANSMHLHKQKPDPHELSAIQNSGCCSICSRSRAPDVFEIVHCEESVVPQLGVFRRWLGQDGEGVDWEFQGPPRRNTWGSIGGEEEEEEEEEGDDGEGGDGCEGFVRWETIARLYSEEFGWACCIATGNEDPRWQVRRGRDARRGQYTRPKDLFVGEYKRRWDILG